MNPAQVVEGGVETSACLPLRRHGPRAGKWAGGQSHSGVVPTITQGRWSRIRPEDPFSAQRRPKQHSEA